MALMIKSEKQIYQAVRHYSNVISLRKNIIKSEANRLNYAYLNGLVKEFDDEMMQIVVRVRALVDIIDKQDSNYIEIQIIKIDAKVRSLANKLINKIGEKKESLKIFASKFDDLLMALVNLAKVKASDFIQGTLQKNAKKVEELGETIPTLSEISYVLRAPDVTFDIVGQRIKDELKYQSRRYYDSYEEDKNIEKFYNFIKPIVAQNSLGYIQDNVKKVLIQNNDSERFIKSTLSRVNDNIFNVHDESFKMMLKAFLEEI